MSLSEPVAPIDRQQCDVYLEVLEPFDHSRVNGRVSRVVDTGTSDVHDEPNKAPSHDWIGFPNTFGDRVSSGSMCCRHGMDRHGSNFHSRVHLSRNHSGVVADETHCLGDCRLRYHEDGCRGCLRNPFDCERIKVIKVIVTAKNDVDEVKH